MAELGVLWGIIAVTLAVMGGLLVVFRPWLRHRDEIDEDGT